MKKLIVITGILLLSGCATVDRAMKVKERWCSEDNRIVREAAVAKAKERNPDYVGICEGS